MPPTRSTVRDALSRVATRLRAMRRLGGRIVPLAPALGWAMIWFRSSFTVESMGGRTIYGGGGITPDLVVLPDTLLAREQAAVQRLFRSANVFATASFDHAVSYVQDHPDLEPGFGLRSADLDEFYRTLIDEHEMVLDESDFVTAVRFVTYQLERQIALQAWGEEGEFLHTRADDRQLNDAIEILRRAETPEALFSLARAAGPIETATGVGGSVPGGSGLN